MLETTLLNSDPILGFYCPTVYTNLITSWTSLFMLFSIMAATKQFLIFIEVNLTEQSLLTYRALEAAFVPGQIWFSDDFHVISGYRFLTAATNLQD